MKLRAMWPLAVLWWDYTHGDARKAPPNEGVYEMTNRVYDNEISFWENPKLVSIN
jgi:hypothetical protein